MTTHASAQRIGTRLYQCDATATASSRGVRAWALLDGIGDHAVTRSWTRETARLVALVAAHTASPDGGIAAARGASSRDGRNEYDYDCPDAVAVVAVLGTDGVVRVAWAGDSRAYWQTPDGALVTLTRDHNLAEVLRSEGRKDFDKNCRNSVTSHIRRSDGEIASVEPPRGPGRLLLCSDGVYSPFEDNGADLGPLLATSSPRTAASLLVRRAVGFPAERRDNATVLVVDFA